MRRTLPEILAMRESALHPDGGEGHQLDQILQQCENDSGVFEEVIVDRDGNRIPVIASTKLLQVADRQLTYRDIS